MFRDLNTLSNAELVSSLKKLKSDENETIAEIVQHLSEIDRRGLYRDEGYSSLYTYCTLALKYSEGAACRRIQSARALRDNPEIYELLKTGKLSLCATSEIAKVIKPENKIELLESSIGKAKTEVQKLTVKYQEAKKPLRHEIVKPKKILSRSSKLAPPVSYESNGEGRTCPTVIEGALLCCETRFTFTMEVDQEFMELLEEAKSVTGPVPAVQILTRTLREFVNKRKKEPRPRTTKEEASNESKPTTVISKKLSRYIARRSRYEVNQRDQHQCTFTSPDGHRCIETKALQLDHIVPFALGGSNEPSNLRLLCPAHNRLCAERIFGREKIESCRHRGGDLSNNFLQNDS